MDDKVQEKRWFGENQEWFVKLRLDEPAPDIATKK